MDTARELTLDIAEPTRFFAEEERSQQPSVFSPLRRLLHAFQGFEDGFLGLYGAFGYDLIHQFEHIERALAREPRCADLRLFLPDSIWLLDRRKETAERFGLRNIRGRGEHRGSGLRALRSASRIAGGGACRRDRIGSYPRGLRGQGRGGPRADQGRRCVRSRPEPRVQRRFQRRAVAPLPNLPRAQPQSLRVPMPVRDRATGRDLAGNVHPGRGRPRRVLSHRRHRAPRRERDGGFRARARALQFREGRG